MFSKNIESPSARQQTAPVGLGRGSGARLTRRALPWAVGLPLLSFALAQSLVAVGIFTPRTGALAQTATDILLVAVMMVVLARRFDSAAGTLRERAEASNQRLAAIVVESAPIAMLMTDRNLEIVLVNRKTQELFGYGREDLVGRDLRLLLPEGLREGLPIAADFSLDPQSLLLGAGFDLFGRHQNGRDIPVEVGLNYLETPDALYVIAAIVDVTEHKQAREELRRSNAELEQFAYVASHDLQEPLRMVASYTELLGQRYRGRLDEKADKYIHYAVDGAKRMQQLVADLLAYSRIGRSGKPFAWVDSGLAVRRAVEALGRQLADAGGRVELAPGLPQVCADPGQLHQVFQNLISNAIKFGREGVPPEIRIAAEELPGTWEFSVADNGIGIEAKYADRIFQMFQRLHPHGKLEGSGIGLALVQRIVERHGGAVRFVSEPGQGATFLFTLAKPRPPAEEKAKPSPKSP